MSSAMRREAGERCVDRPSQLPDVGVLGIDLGAPGAVPYLAAVSIECVDHDPALDEVLVFVCFAADGGHLARERHALGLIALASPCSARQDDVPLLALRGRYVT